MRKFAMAAFGAALLLPAAPALAATGQCYDKAGLAVGAPYDMERPNRALIDQVVGAGGKCTSAGDLGPYGPGFDGRGPGESFQYRDSRGDSAPDRCSAGGQCGAPEIR